MILTDNVYVCDILLSRVLMFYIFQQVVGSIGTSATEKRTVLQLNVF